MSQPPEIPRIEAADTPWGVPVLDVRAVTENMISTSADPQCAANALSYLLLGLRSTILGLDLYSGTGLPVSQASIIPFTASGASCWIQ